MSWRLCLTGLKFCQQLAAMVLILANTVLGFSKPHTWQWDASDVFPINAEKASLPCGKYC